MILFKKHTWLFQYICIVLITIISVIPHMIQAKTIKEKNVITLRKASDRGHGNHSWLKSDFTFSFADYFDPNFTGFRTLKVINEDKIKGGYGFAPHSHKDMEIITYVIQGALQHKDSMGNTSIIRAGEVQRMRAGKGVVHSEYNYEKNQDTHLYQIWITPNKKSNEPSYVQKSFAADLKSKKLVLVVSKTGRNESLDIDQDADIYLSHLTKGESLSYRIQPERYIWVQMVKGKMKMNGYELSSGDGISIQVEKNDSLQFKALEEGEFLLFDLG